MGAGGQVCYTKKKQGRGKESREEMIRYLTRSSQQTEQVKKKIEKVSEGGMTLQTLKAPSGSRHFMQSIRGFDRQITDRTPRLMQRSTLITMQAWMTPVSQ